MDQCSLSVTDIAFLLVRYTRHYQNFFKPRAARAGYEMYGFRKIDSIVQVWICHMLIQMCIEKSTAKSSEMFSAGFPPTRE
jgi:hypothetical protein